MVLPYYVDRGRRNLTPSELALLEPLYDYRMVGTGDASEWVKNEIPYTYAKQLGDNWLAFYSPTGEYQGDDLQSTHRGDFREFFRELATGVAIVGGFAWAYGGVSASNVIGKAIVGDSFAAAYPGITQAIGNASVNTAANGGNIELTVTNLAASYAGSVAGGYAKVLSNSALLANVTSSVVTAAALDRDINEAVRSSLINYGISNMNDLIDFKDIEPMPATTPPVTFDNGGGVFYPGGGFGYELPADIYPVDFAPDTNMLFDTDNVLDQIYDTGGVYYDYDYGGGGDDLPPSNDGNYNLPPYVYEPPALDPVAIPDVTINQPVNSSGSGGFLPGLTAAMTAALQLVRAYQQVRSPIVNNPSIVTAQGVRRVNSNGTITVTAPNGQVTTTKPAVGVAQTTTDGGLIVNNGDGTYTYIDQLGQRYVRSYPATITSTSPTTSLFSGGNNTLLIAGGIGVAALLLLSKKRRA